MNNNKLDGLGRIAIPKDIRDKLNLMENDYIDFILVNQYIILKKNSKLGNLCNLLQKITDLLSSSLKAEVFIAEKNCILAYSGMNKDLYYKKNPSRNIIKSIIRRENLYEKYFKYLEIIDNIKIECSYINESIIKNDEVFGIIFLYRENKIVDKYDLNAIDIAKKFIEKNI